MRAEFKECQKKNQALEFFCDRFYVGQNKSRRQGMRRYCLCAVMIYIQDNVIQSCNRIISGSGKIKVVIQIVRRCTLVYITDILPMYIRYVTLGIFYEELSVLIQ